MSSQSATYSYDLNGNLETRSDNLVLGALETFTYDPMNRLTAAGTFAGATVFT